MADDQDSDCWKDDEFLAEAFQQADTAASTSTSNPTQQLPQHYHQPPLQPSQPQHQQQFNCHPRPIVHSAPSISHSPPWELSQIVEEADCRNFSKEGFDRPESLNGLSGWLPHSSRLPDEDKDSKEQEIDRLKKELGRVSKELTNLEQECSELRKERDNKEKQLRSAFSRNECKDDEAPFPKKPNLKNKVPIQDHIISHPGCEGIIPCKAVGVQTDEHTELNDLKMEKNSYVTYASRKLIDIWEPQSDQEGRNLVSKLFVACETDFRVLFGCLGLNILYKTKVESSRHERSSDKACDHCIQTFDSTEAAKISHLYFTLTKISYDISRLEALLEALQELCSVQNSISFVEEPRLISFRIPDEANSLKRELEQNLSPALNDRVQLICDIVFGNKNDDCSQISLCTTCGFEPYVQNGKEIVQQCTVLRDNIVVEDPSSLDNSSDKHSEIGYLSCEKNKETSNPRHPVVTRILSANKVSNKDDSSDDPSLSISCSKWVSLFQLMHQLITRYGEEDIRLEAVSIMNVILLRTDAYAEREKYGQVMVFQSISQLLRREAGLGVQKQAVHLLYLLLNCPTLLAMFCTACKEEGSAADAVNTDVKVASTFQGFSAILDGLADCLACHGYGMQKVLVLKLRQSAINLLAFLASSGRSGFEILLGLRRINFLYLILQTLASEIDVEASESIQPSEVFRERTLLIREALILLNRLASNPQYSSPVLRILTSTRDMACLTVDTANRLSRKGKWLWQSDIPTRQMRESEIVDLARIFKKRVFTFLGDAVTEK